MVLNWLGGCHSERASKEPYLNAFLGPLCAVHHGGEGERGDETTQEVLDTHAQDGHTWERKRTSKRNHCKSTKMKFCPKKKAGNSHFCLLRYTSHYVALRGSQSGDTKRGESVSSHPPILLFPITATTHPSPSPSPQFPLVPKSHVAYPRRGRNGAVGKHRGTTEPICLCCLRR